MLYWGAVFFIFAVVAGFVGFGGFASAFVGLSQVLFFVFLLLFIVALIIGDPYLRRF